LPEKAYTGGIGLYKVLITDDEIKMCRLIQNVIDWDSLGLEIVGFAHDGIAALELIKSEKPDILITDIRMPGCDGLELIAKAKEANPGMYFVIISGYQHFDYARSAIRFGVEDYLLKPLDEEELLEILTKMTKKLNKEEDISDRLQKRLESDTQRMRQAFIELLIREPSRLPAPLDREEINREYHCGFRQGLFQVIVIKADILDKKAGKDARQLLAGRVRKISESALKPQAFEVLSLITREGVYFLLNMDEEYNLGLRKRLRRIRMEISALRDLFFDISPTVGMGIITDEFSLLPSSAQGAGRAVLNRLLMGTGHIIGVTEKAQSSCSLKDIVDNQTKTSIQERIEVLDIDETERLLEKLRKRINSQKGMDGELLLEICRDIMTTLWYASKKLDPEISWDKLYEEFTDSFYMCTNVDEVFELLLLSFRQVIGGVVEMKESTAARPIRIAKKYIQDHYNEPLRLEDISSIAGFNPSYFSGLFKKETGMGFSEYLVSVRMSRAKQLLIDSRMSVEDVAGEVGYTDIKHFSKSFKKSAGLNPTSFRKLYHRLD